MKKGKHSSKYEQHIESLDRFNKLNLNEQNELLKDILADSYGSRKKVNSKTLLKIEELAKEKQPRTLRLENHITVENDLNNLIFTFSRTRVLPILIFYVGVLVLLSSAATFSYLLDAKRGMLNIDIDGDGIPDLNIDINNDEIAEINIDTNNDKKPNINIDYMHNNKSIFNVRKGKKIFNIINNDTNNDGKCDLNCDTNNDGWPDINLDLDGDGKPDMFIDKDNTGKPTLNIDVDGDMVCDIQCDLDGDLKCDEYCLSDETIKYLDFNEIIDNSNIIGTEIPALSVIGNEINCKDLYPTDQPQANAKKECITSLLIRNDSTLDIEYDLYLDVLEYTFTSNNFKYKITSNNNGGNINNYITVPRTNHKVFDKVMIKARESQNYTVSFILEGMNENQAYDAGKNFNGEFRVDIR